MNVYQAINAVQADLSQVGIAKNRTNTQGAGFKFRGIDDVLNALSPLLAKHGLVIIPRVISRTCTCLLYTSDAPQRVIADPGLCAHGP